MSDTPRTDAQRYDCEYRGYMGSKFTADMTELIERLQERTQSHIHASQRDVQTIQQQAIEIERIKGVNTDLLEALKLLASHGHADDCLLINRAGESCDCGLDYAHVIIAKAKGVQP